MRVGIFFLIVCLIIAGLVYMAFKIDISSVVKIEMKEPEVVDEPIAYVTPGYYHLIYPQYYSFKDMLIRVDKPVDGISKITIEKE